MKLIASISILGILTMVLIVGGVWLAFQTFKSNKPKE